MIFIAKELFEDFLLLHENFVKFGGVLCTFCLERGSVWCIIRHHTDYSLQNPISMKYFKNIHIFCQSLIKVIFCLSLENNNNAL